MSTSPACIQLKFRQGCFEQRQDLYLFGTEGYRTCYPMILADIRIQPKSLLPLYSVLQEAHQLNHQPPSPVLGTQNHARLSLTSSNAGIY